MVQIQGQTDASLVRADASKKIADRLAVVNASQQKVSTEAAALTQSSSIEGNRIGQHKSYDANRDFALRQNDIQEKAQDTGADIQRNSGDRSAKAQQFFSNQQSEIGFAVGSMQKGQGGVNQGGDVAGSAARGVLSGGAGGPVGMLVQPAVSGGFEAYLWNNGERPIDLQNNLTQGNNNTLTNSTLLNNNLVNRDTKEMNKFVRTKSDANNIQLTEESKQAADASAAIQQGGVNAAKEMNLKAIDERLQVELGNNQLNLDAEKQGITLINNSSAEAASLRAASSLVSAFGQTASRNIEKLGETLRP